MHVWITNSIYQQPDAKTFKNQVGLGLARRLSGWMTGYGSKVKGKNYFGIKGKGQAFTTHEEVDGLMVKQKDEFRTYDSLEDSVRDYALFLQENKRYRPLLEAKTLDQQIDALAGSGYATDSKYGDKIRGIIEGKTFKELIG